MAHSFAFIFGADAVAGRALRRTPVGVEHGHKGAVCIVELRPGEYEELDADSVEHARTLATAWVQRHMAISASVWSVNARGELHGKPEIIAPEFEAA